MSVGRFPQGKMEATKQLLEQGKTNKEIAQVIYGDQTERGQRRIRAIRSKLRKSGKLADASISSNEGSFATEEKRAEKGEEGKTDQKTQELSQPSCGGVVASQPLSSQPFVGDFEVVRAPVAGLGSRVGYVLERDVITAVLLDPVAANAVQKLAHRLTGAGFYVYHHDGVAFQSKGDVVSISEPNGDVARAAEALKDVLKTGTNLSMKHVEKIASRVKHPSQIGYDELTVDLADFEIIEIIRRCEPHIPDAARGPYVILAPSPLIPGLKIYLKSPPSLRIELVAHNEKQAFNAFFIRAELVGDVLPRIKRSPGVFDEWRAQYWHPYSHPMIINLAADVSSILKARYKKTSRPAEGVRTFDALPSEIREVVVDLRNRGVVYFNDFRVILSDNFKRFYRKDPSKIIEQLAYANPLKREMVSLLLQKTAVDYDHLLRRLREVQEKSGLNALKERRPDE